MATRNYTARAQSGRLIELPEDAETLGLQPGDEVTIRIETKNGAVLPYYEPMLDVALRDILEEAKKIQPQPGKESNDPYEWAFGEIMKEKYCKQGFEI